ncbi:MULTISPECIES: LysR substrate-binding domain-containing protein [Microbacterium]|uniref:LysR substrate-binding domain-containing protein n=1 Tax=Microbacterium TaxID=33882 RepID=UPI00217D2721|nr:MULTISPECIES: LysR substrate-binding domain-containing protein [Microbacterium]UWF77241.1 transcriptional regulator [Microbacterium neungamense]WCM55396.1 transcriptional regulator [Microbacterium sp. EF45047]
MSSQRRGGGPRGRRSAKGPARPGRAGGQGGAAGRKGGAARGRADAAQSRRRPDDSAEPGRTDALAPQPPSAEATSGPRVFRLGVVPGATPGRWIDTWNRRMPGIPLELVPIAVATQREELETVDAALIRLPVARADDLHVIRLYDEVPVVVASAESHLMAADELTAEDLAGEVLITPGDDVLGPLDLPTQPPAFPPLETTADAVATAASGVGIVVLPMSLARLHHRRDAGHRPLVDGPASTVALAWRRDRTTPEVEAFVGIVRGRTENSSR